MGQPRYFPRHFNWGGARHKGLWRVFWPSFRLTCGVNPKWPYGTGFVVLILWDHTHEKTWVMDAVLWCVVSWVMTFTPIAFKTSRLSDVLAKTLTNLRAAGRRHFFTLPNCWELFGVDFLVEARSARTLLLGIVGPLERWDTGTELLFRPMPRLLEINPSPSLAMYSADLKDLVGEDPLSCELSPAWHQLQLWSAKRCEEKLPLIQSMLDQ